MTPCNRRPVSGQRARIGAYAENADAYTLFNLLTGPRLLERVEAALPTHRERLFPPTEALAMFLARAVSADGSCQHIVNQVALQRTRGGLPRCATDTGAYCRARSRLPEQMIAHLARESGALISGDAPGWWRRKGRQVHLVDGAMVTLADTAANQLEDPPPRRQRPGLGFPMRRVVVLMCLGSGALLDAAIGPCQGKGSDEQALLRRLLDGLQRGDILLGDAFYPTNFLLCELVRGGVDGVFEQYGARRRSTDFSTGEHLGERDHLITVPRPHKPEWMRPYAYEQVPATLTVRELQAGGKQGGVHPCDGAAIHTLLIRIAEPRIEPRALKRRPKPYPFLMQPREAARAHIRAHGHPQEQH